MKLLKNFLNHLVETIVKSEKVKQKLVIMLINKMKGLIMLRDCYLWHKISLYYGGQYIDSSNWIKNKKGRINHVKNMMINFSIHCKIELTR